MSFINKVLSQREFTFLDGAMGTMLQRSGLKLGQNPVVLAITHPEQISAIHRQYIDAGAEIVYTNTFGANEHKLEGTGYTVEEVITAAVACGKRACEGTKAVVALDIGPIGELLEPSGTLSQKEAYQIFARQMVAGREAGADLIVIETMTDLYEVKTAVLAAKENTELPVFVTMSFEKNGRTFTGCGVEAMAAVLEGLGVDAIGINCSLGPGEIYPIAAELAKCTTLPLIVKANAGLPNLENGNYDVTAEQYAAELQRFAALGVSIVGGCCGTDPEYIRAMKAALNGIKPEKRLIEPKSVICTPTKTVVVDRVRVIGERINPTGKKRFQQALQEGDMDYILSQGVAQADAGADILDVNVGMPGVDEPKMMERTIRSLQSVLDVPLQIDSSDPCAIEAGLRAYNGKAIVNSVNGEQAVLEQILPIVKKYGAAVVGLTLDEKGIPSKAEDRLKIAKRIMTAAQSYGIQREDIYIDCLTLTVSAQQEDAAETLKAVHLVKKELGLRTVLGVSNISFGLPERELMNQTFLTIAMSQGLDLPIINPNKSEMMDAICAFQVLYHKDKGAKKYIERFGGKKAELGASTTQNDRPMDIFYAIDKGLKEDVRRITIELLQECTELELINQKLIPALDKVGERYEKGGIFLPQLISSANAAQEAFEIIKKRIAEQGSASVSKGKIVLATVKGDIHDIGKNIVKVILENYGYQILDLGRDVPIETVVETVIKEDVKLVGLSALMTTTLKSMEQTIVALRKRKHECTVFVGGAVLTADYAEKIGADYFAKDAKQSVDIAKKILG